MTAFRATIFAYKVTNAIKLSWQTNCHCLQLAYHIGIANAFTFCLQTDCLVLCWSPAGNLDCLWQALLTIHVVTQPGAIRTLRIHFLLLTGSHRFCFINKSPPFYFTSFCLYWLGMRNFNHQQVVFLIPLLLTLRQCNSLHWPLRHTQMGVGIVVTWGSLCGVIVAYWPGIPEMWVRVPL